MVVQCGAIIFLLADIFWDNDDFADHYGHCRRYLEIPKRVEILNQRYVIVPPTFGAVPYWLRMFDFLVWVIHRLDIIKDLYDMLNSELEIQVRVRVAATPGRFSPAFFFNPLVRVALQYFLP